jgi:hypothetical protein
MEQDAYYDHVRGAYASTRQVPTYDPSRADKTSDDVIAKLKDLGELHRSGSLTDEEFAAAKGRLLGSQDAAT